MPVTLPSPREGARSDALRHTTERLRDGENKLMNDSFTPDGLPTDAPPDDNTASAVSQPNDLEPWKSIFDDPLLSRPPSAGTPGNVPPGDNLRLDIGWNRFEQLLVFVAQGVLGLHQIRFRRYGVGGQPQHGIDLAGRRPTGAYTVVQCKEYDVFGQKDLRAAVETFAKGKRPFGAKHLIVAVSTIARTTQLEEELSALQNQYQELEIELWGSEQINDVLRERADIVSRFWTRETAETFCTGAPLPGVAAPPPNWVRVADQILLSPLGVDGLDQDLAEADRLRGADPSGAAQAYEQLAAQLAAEGFIGHAYVLRRKQIDALAAASKIDAVVALTAELAALALHGGDMHQAGSLEHRLRQLIESTSAADAANTAGAIDASTARHAELIRAALFAVEHQLADRSALTAALRNAPAHVPRPEYQPLLVLQLAELTAADAVVAPSEQMITPEPHTHLANASPVIVALSDLDDLITAALTQLGQVPSTSLTKDVAFRLRLVRTYYDTDERTNLLTEARQLRLPRHHAALVLSGQARRDALEGSAPEAIEHWRQAVAHAIHDGHPDDAGGWLYAIRAVNMRYGPWTDHLDEEHMLAQALPKTGTGRLIRRVRDAETDARRAALDGRPIEAIRAARRWLADSIVTGDWVGEGAAAELLGDLYASHRETGRAAACYLWAGKTKKVTELATTVGDYRLPVSPIGIGPWWQQCASLACLATQHDLIDDEAAAQVLATLLDLVARSRAGELVDSPMHSLNIQATKTACVFAARGTSGDAKAVLDMFATDVARAENQYKHHDDEHVGACQTIITHHEELAGPALARIFDLAQVGTHKALEALRSDVVLDLLREPADKRHVATPTLDATLRKQFRDRLDAIATAGLYEAGLAVAALGGRDDMVTTRARQARDRLLNRPEPDGHTFQFMTQMVPDSYKVSFLGVEDRQACLEKTLTIASDRREAASNRQNALTAAANLVLGQPDNIKASVHQRSRSFVEGNQDGSALDDETTDPHPLSTFKVNFGPSSLRAAGLRLAQFSAVTDEDKAWVRDEASVMLGSNQKELVHMGAVTLSSLGADVLGGLDPTLLMGHPLPVVRQLAAVIAAASPVMHSPVLEALAGDPDPSVRMVLADRLVIAQSNTGPETDEVPAVISEVLDVLASDVRHSVRRAARGHAH